MDDATERRRMRVGGEQSRQLKSDAGSCRSRFRIYAHLYPIRLIIAFEYDGREGYIGGMPSERPREVEAAVCIRTLRLKVKPEVHAWLNAAAVEVNQVWNFANESSAKAARPYAGAPKWLSAYDLHKLTAGATEYFERIGSETIQRVNEEFATRRKQFNKIKLRWRSSRGPRRALGWIAFKAAQLKRKGKSLRFSGKALRVFEQDRLAGVK